MQELAWVRATTATARQPMLDGTCDDDGYPLLEAIANFNRGGITPMEDIAPSVNLHHL